MRQKERKKTIEQKASLTKKEKSLDEEEKQVTNSLTAVLDILMEGNEKVKSVVEKSATAQLIIDTAKAKTGEYHQKLEEIRKKQKENNYNVVLM